MILHAGAAFVLIISGRDHVDLLQRITSNEVRGLAVGGENHHCLLNAKGAIIVPFTLRRAVDHVEIEGPLELKAACIEMIERYVFAEDVVVVALPDVARSSDEDERIFADRPKWGVDVDAETIPWEAGMSEYVSTSKGCYTGQETIARIETYGRVARRLMRLTCATGARAEEAAHPAAGEITRDGKACGAITSVASRPRDGVFAAIGMIRREVAEGETVTGPDGAAWTAVAEI